MAEIGGCTTHQALLNETLTSDKPNPTTELYAIAKCALHTGLTGKVLQIGQQLLEINSNDGMAYYYSGQALIQLGKLAEAQESLTKATELCFDQPLPWLGLAKLHQQNGDQEQALATLQAAAQAIPDSSDIYLRLGEMHWNTPYTYKVSFRANQLALPP
jgi:tetratricopeptide (TPR) repeat protein